MTIRQTTLPSAEVADPWAQWFEDVERLEVTPTDSDRDYQ
jgi:hypothetical protein